MKVGRFTIKKRITLDIMGECDEALQAAKIAKSEKDAVSQLKRIVRLLTESKFVFKRDLRLVDKILLAAGFSGDKSEIEHDKEWLINLTSWIGVHAHKLPYEVATGTTATEAAKFAKAIARKIVDDAIRFWRIQHDPEDILKELTNDLKKLTNSEAEEIKLTAPKGPSMATLFKNAYGAR